MTHKDAINKLLTTLPFNKILYNNNVGTAYTSNEVYKQGKNLVLKNARVVNYGLGGKAGVGMPDLIGFTLTKITPEMVGSVIPVFSSVEMKIKKDRLRPAQKNWNRILANYGCYSKVLRYNEETEDFEEE